MVVASLVANISSDRLTGWLLRWCRFAQDIAQFRMLRHCLCCAAAILAIDFWSDATRYGPTDDGAGLGLRMDMGR